MHQRTIANDFTARRAMHRLNGLYGLHKHFLEAAQQEMQQQRCGLFAKLLLTAHSLRMSAKNIPDQTDHWAHVRQKRATFLDVLILNHIVNLCDYLEHSARRQVKCLCVSMAMVRRYRCQRYDHAPCSGALYVHSVYYGQ